MDNGYADKGDTCVDNGYADKGIHVLIVHTCVGKGYMALGYRQRGQI